MPSGAPREREQAPRDVAHRDDVEARPARGGDAQGQAGRGVGQGGDHADEPEQEIRGRAARGVRRGPHHGARTEDAHVDAAASPGGAQRGLGLELDALVGVVEVLADVAVALDTRCPSAGHTRRRSRAAPRCEAAARQRLEQAHRALDVAGPEGLGVFGKEDRLARAVDHDVDRRAQARHGRRRRGRPRVGGDRPRRPRDRRRRAVPERGGDARRGRLAAAGRARTVTALAARPGAGASPRGR